VTEFRTSGLRAEEFCRIHGLTHETLQRGLRRERIASGSQGGVKGLVAVEVNDGNGLEPTHSTERSLRIGSDPSQGSANRTEPGF
jgi:hypothetical protein